MSNFAWWYYLWSFTCSYHFQWPWPHVKVTALLNSFNWKKLLSYPVKLKFCSTVKEASSNEYTTIFHFSTYSREIIDMFPELTKTYHWPVQERFFKLCMIITWKEGNLGALCWQKPLRLIRDREVGGSGILYLTPTRYTHRQNDSALRRTAVWAIWMFH